MGNAAEIEARQPNVGNEVVHESKTASGAASDIARAAWIVALACTLVSLTAAGFLAAPDITHQTFCDPGGGCEAVAESIYATPSFEIFHKAFHIHLWAIGLASFALALVAVVLPRKRAVPWLTVPVAFGALIGGSTFILIQAVKLHHLCKFCMVADSSAVILGVALLVEAGVYASRTIAYRPKIARWVALPVGLLLPVIPVAIAAAHVPMTHTVVSFSDAHRIVLREFIDLQCPYCRATQKALKPALEARPDVKVDRKMVPLAFHEHAMEAAIAACCAGEQGKEDAFVDAVVSIDQLPNADVCRAAAAKVGVDLSAFDACRQSDRPKQRIASDTALFHSTQAPGLPTLDIDGERSIGGLDQARAAALLARHPKKTPETVK